MISEPEINNDVATNSYEYWLEYYLTLYDFIEEYKRELEKKCLTRIQYKNDYFIPDVHINFNYDIDFHNEKVAELYSELNRVKIVMSALKHSSTFNINPITLQSSMNNG